MGLTSSLYCDLSPIRLCPVPLKFSPQKFLDPSSLLFLHQFLLLSIMRTLIVLAICVVSTWALRIPFQSRRALETAGSSSKLLKYPTTAYAPTRSTTLSALPSKQVVKDKLEAATNAFPLWVLASSIGGWLKPSLFQWFSPYVTQALAATMLFMGMTLTVNDFKRVAMMPQWVLFGFIAQFSIMPLASAASAKLWGLCPDLASGLILVGCAPGGTASNLVSLIAKADVALSVLMTMCSTVAAVVMTPLLTAKLAGGYVQIKASELVMSTLNVVLLPTTLGLVLNSAAPSVTKKVAEVTPFLSVLFVSAICGCISASNSGTAIKTIGLRLLGAILTLHSVGFALGYFFSKNLGATESRARTISIETGMQNSALAVVLAKHFPNPALSSLPGAISATVHSIIGSILASYWRGSPDPKINYAVSKRYW